MASIAWIRFLKISSLLYVIHRFTAWKYGSQKKCIAWRDMIVKNTWTDLL